MEDTSSYYFHCLELWAEATEMSWLPTGKTLTHRCPTGQLAILVGTWSKSWHSRWSTVGLETVAVSCYMVSLAGPGASFSWLLSVQLLSWPSLAFSRHHCCEWVHLRCIPLPLPTRGILVSFCCSTYLALCNLVSLDGCQYRWWREDCVYLCFRLKKSFINDSPWTVLRFEAVWLLSQLYFLNDRCCSSLLHFSDLTLKLSEFYARFFLRCLDGLHQLGELFRQQHSSHDAWVHKPRMTKPYHVLP